jgi:macrolide-specific efflux system membrane fusion protein
MTAYFTTLAGGSRRWSSTVRQILPVPPRPLEASQGGSPSGGRSGSERVVLYTVLLDVDNTDRSLMTDMTAQVFFVAAQAKDVLTVPIAALHDAGQVRVLADNGDVQMRTVRTGISDRLRTQILDGLSEGDRVLIGPVSGSGG